MENQKYNAVDLLNDIGDALIKYKALNGIYSVTTTLGLPKDSYKRFKDEFEIQVPSVNIEDIFYAGLKYKIIEAD